MSMPPRRNPLAPFRPALVDALRDYSRARFMQDLSAGATVGIVALPLVMAFAMASGSSRKRVYSRPSLRAF